VDDAINPSRDQIQMCGGRGRRDSEQERAHRQEPAARRQPETAFSTRLDVRRDPRPAHGRQRGRLGHVSRGLTGDTFDQVRRVELFPQSSGISGVALHDVFFPK
jgi:hypothetical protein